jgi:hypothetical protein
MLRAQWAAALVCTACLTCTAQWVPQKAGFCAEQTCKSAKSAKNFEVGQRLARFNFRWSFSGLLPILGTQLAFAE